MPLVRTPMIAPTKIYRYVPTLSPEQAADLIAYAIIKRPKRLATHLGRLASITYSIAPEINNMFMSIGFNLFPSSSASVGKQEKLNWVQRAYARIFPVNTGKYNYFINKNASYSGGILLVSLFQKIDPTGLHIINCSHNGYFSTFKHLF